MNEQELREQIAKEIEANGKNGLPWHNYTVQDEILKIVRGH